MSDYNLVNDDDLMDMEGDKMLEEASIRANVQRLDNRLSDLEEENSQYSERDDLFGELEQDYFEI